MQTIPWILCAVTALWMGALAARARQGWFAWGLAGAVYALVVSTIVCGVRQATLIPITSNAYSSAQMQAFLGAAALVLIPGALASRILLQRGREQQREFAASASVPASPAPSSSAGPTPPSGQGKP